MRLHILTIQLVVPEQLNESHPILSLEEAKETLTEELCADGIAKKIKQEHGVDVAKVISAVTVDLEEYLAGEA